MYKRLIVLLVSLFLFITLPINTIANESQDYKFFGINATIEKFTNNSYEIILDGKKAKEGVVFSKIVNGGEEVAFDIDLKGNDEVILKISETNSAGHFIQETISDPINLVEKWSSHSINHKLSNETSEIDVFVLTVKKSKANIYFRNVKLSLN